MQGFLWGILAVVGFVLPLELLIDVNWFSVLAGNPWNFWAALQLSVLLGVYGYLFFKRKQVLQQPVVQWVLVFSAVAGGSYFLSATSVESFWGLMGVLGVLWSLPVLLWIVRGRGRALLLLLVFVAVLHGSWGIAHVVMQRDVGWTAIGESDLAPDLSGVAKFSLGVVGGDAPGLDKIIRGYGATTHPNVLAGTVLVGLLVLALLRQRLPAIVWLSLGFVLGLALLLTFSRAGWLGGALLGLMVLAGRGVERRVKLGLMVFTIVVLLASPLVVARSFDVEDQAVIERMRGVSYALAIMREQPLWQGVGMGQYSSALAAFVERTDVTVAPWEIAPVHSVPLLLMAEWGMLWGGLLLVLVGWLLAQRWRSWGVLLVPLLPLLLTDHFFLTQPALLLYLLALVVGVQSDRSLRFRLARVQPRG